MPGTRSGAVARAHECFDSGAYLAHLRDLVAVPTESQLPERLPDLRRYCDSALPPLLAGMGFTHEVLENPEAGCGPVLLATRIEDASRPTVLLYGHGDVVRGLAPQWSNGRDPWAVTVEGDRWYGRGTADNKGQHLIAIEALRATLAERGALGFNVKLLVETGEEVGSPGLAEFLERHKDRCAADVFIALDGPRQTTFLPELSLGARGAVAFDLIVDFRATEHHSGHFGGVLDDAGFVLAHALSTIVTPRGKILVEDWLPKSVPASVNDAIDALTIEDMPGMPQASPDWGEPGLSRPRRIYGWTSVIVLAFTCGHPDAPTNAVQGRARARLQVRHTVDVPAETIVPALRRHLEAKGFGMVKVQEVMNRAMFAASRTPPDDPWVKRVVESLARSSNRKPNLLPNSSGSSPTELFRQILGVPAIWIPNSYPGCNQHGPDEHALAPLLREGLGLMAGLWWDIGERA
ncbi:M20/M25/M40 family metallo-hydrolase [Roseomonas eburnea]|uniref:M20/M25/M40 family metallo-hydrolase n=1 Tax=Neoroseomonas eburnea TaxID=1346889 RepID=A0A9X9X7A1_9PROT|nr:M20/M25/M40 family metallo-hydrolase [Neoroseomonas eburnea]MBR0679587.1 M20/M25/M40 family metallo-hydrolase [Neoroseomonas eburnea]